MYCNKINSGKWKFKVLNNLSQEIKIIYQNKTEELRDILLEVKIKGRLLFIRIEQGSGINSNNILVILILRIW